MNATKGQNYSFYRFCVIKGKPTGRAGGGRGEGGKTKVKMMLGASNS